MRKRKVFKIAAIVFSSLIMLELTNIQVSKADATLPEVPIQLHAYDISVAAGESESTIQSAIDTASSKGGGTVTLDSGTYTITTPIVLKSNVTLTGDGKNSTILQRSSSSDLGLSCSVITAISGGLSNVIVKSLTIDGNDIVDPSTTPAADSWHNGGIVVTDGSSSNTNDKLLFDDIIVENSTMGFHIKGTKNLTVQNSDFINNGGCYDYWHNMYLRRVSYTNIYNCNMYGSTSGNGLNVSYSDNVTVSYCNSYNNYFRGLRFADSSYIDVFNCEVYGNKTGDGIILNTDSKTGVSNFRLETNTVSNNHGYGILTNSACSNGGVGHNVDGRGNSNGFKSLAGTNINFES
jgi:parallel beta-helix repeat protein